MIFSKRLQVAETLALRVVEATGLPLRRNLDYALDEAVLPAVVVQSGADAPNDEFTTANAEARSLDMEVILLVANTDDRELATDLYESQIAAALALDETLGGAAVVGRYTGGSWQFDLGDVAARSLAYSFVFYPDTL